MTARLFPLFMLGLISCSCQNEAPDRKAVTRIPKQITAAKPKSINKLSLDIIPFEGIREESSKDLFERLKMMFPDAILKNPVSFPANAWYAPRHRYKADSLISYLSSITPPGHVALGITDKDISTSKDEIADWGIMGLGFCPGNACVISSFRLSKSNLPEQFFKVAVHELGHTQGLDHCENKTCFMRDAEGKNTTDQEKAFCPNCKAFLLKKGWTIH